MLFKNSSDFETQSVASALFSWLSNSPLYNIPTVFIHHFWVNNFTHHFKLLSIKMLLMLVTVLELLLL